MMTRTVVVITTEEALRSLEGVYMTVCLPWTDFVSVNVQETVTTSQVCSV